MLVSPSSLTTISLGNVVKVKIYITNVDLEKEMGEEKAKAIWFNQQKIT